MESLPNFFAIIPASVRYCKGLEPSAKLLYGEITALSNKYGYCFATNKYFAEIYDVDERTIRRWIETLKENNFIDIEVFLEGTQTIRKIWVSREVKEMFTGGQKCPGGGVKNVPRGRQKCPTY